MSFQQAVLERLMAPAGSVSRFLLVDQSGLPTLCVSRLLDWPGATWDLLSLGPVDWRAGASPVLLEAPTPGLSAWQQRVFEIQLTRWQHSNALTYLEAPFAAEAMVSHVSGRILARVPDGDEVVLRWFDGRTASALLETLDVEQRAALWHGFDVAWSLGRAGERQDLRRGLEASGVTSDAGQAMHSPLRIQVDQELALLTACEADVLLDQLLRHAPAALLMQTPPEQHAWVAAELRACERSGLTQITAQIDHCLQALELAQL